MGVYCDPLIDDKWEGVRGCPKGPLVPQPQDNIHAFIFRLIPHKWRHVSDSDAGCAAYKQNNWCTSNGELGPNAPFSSFDDVADADGVTAPMACCACGKNSMPHNVF